MYNKQQDQQELFKKETQCTHRGGYSVELQENTAKAGLLYPNKVLRAIMHLPPFL